MIRSNPLTAAYLGYALALSGRFDAAVAESRRAVELDSSNLAAHSQLAFTYRAAGRATELLDLARRILTMTNDPRRHGIAAYSLGYLGRTAEARAVVEKLEALPVDTPGRNAGLGYAYLGLGDTARALSSMERAAAMPGGDLLFAIVPSDPTLNPIRASPRFAAILKHFTST